jgi:tetratricopeptide (TPR) repeat protein
MVNKAVYLYVLVSLAAGYALLNFFIFPFSHPSIPLLEQARAAYQEAAQSNNFFHRRQALNRLLMIYHSLDKLYCPLQGNGALYSNLAETYFNLEQYPWAAFYFYQAKRLRPRDLEVEFKLKETLAKLKIPPTQSPSLFKKLFFFHFYFSLPERLEILCVFTFLLCSLASLLVWKNYVGLKLLVGSVALVNALFFCSIIYSQYFEPIEGVLIHATHLYGEKNLNSALVTLQPLRGGCKVEVLESGKQGRVLKIRTPDHLIGFISQESIRLLRP